MPPSKILQGRCVKPGASFQVFLVAFSLTFPRFPRISKNLLNTSRQADFFKHSFFFSYTIFEWNKLDSVLRNDTSYSMFRNSLLKFGWVNSSSVYYINEPIRLKLLPRLRLGLSHLNEDRFRHDFQYCVNPLSTCSLEVESTKHFFLYCHNYADTQQILVDNVKKIHGY